MRSPVAAVLLLALAACPCLRAAEPPVAEPMGPALPVLLNALPGIGMGSFVQRDPLGGLIGLGGEILGVGLMGYGVVYAIGQAVAVSLVEVFTLGYGEPTVQTRTVEALVFGGLAVWGCTKLFEIIRPFWFASRRTQEVAAAGTAAPELIVLVAPGRAPGATTFAPGLGVAFRF